MSCTVIAIPFALAPILSAITAGAVVGNIASEIQGLSKTAKNMEFNDTEINIEPDTQMCMEDVLSERGFHTKFMDKDILLKTLEEHGVVDLTEAENGVLTGRVSNYKLRFEKPSEDQPYDLLIVAPENCDSEEKVNDIESEYRLNVQESAYLSILEKLKENNMQIEEETVEDDNTIVLTINLE